MPETFVTFIWCEITCNSPSNNDGKTYVKSIIKRDILYTSSSDSPVLWIRIDPEVNLIRQVSFKQSDFMWHFQLRHERDVIAQAQVKSFFQYIIIDTQNYINLRGTLFWWILSKSYNIHIYAWPCRIKFVKLLVWLIEIFSTLTLSNFQAKIFPQVYREAEIFPQHTRKRKSFLNIQGRTNLFLTYQEAQIFRQHTRKHSLLIILGSTSPPEHTRKHKSFLDVPILLFSLALISMLDENATTLRQKHFFKHMLW